MAQVQMWWSEWAFWDDHQRAQKHLDFAIPLSHCDGIDESREATTRDNRLSSKLLHNQHPAMCWRHILVPARLTWNLSGAGAKMVMISTLGVPLPYLVPLGSMETGAKPTRPDPNRVEVSPWKWALFHRIALHLKSFMKRISTQFTSVPNHI